MQLFTSFDLGDHLEMTEEYIESHLKPVMKNMLRNIDVFLQDDDYLDLCAQRSYQHHNGFKKIVLGISPQGRKLVLHYWEDEIGRDSDFHTHRWNFVSHVVTGRIQLWDYIEKDGAAIAVSRYNYSSPADTSGYSVAYDREATLLQTRRRIISQGQSYLQKQEIIHQAETLDAPTMTIIIQDHVKTHRTHVYRPVENRPGEFTEVDRLTPSGICEALEDLQTRLAR